MSCHKNRCSHQLSNTIHNTEYTQMYFRCMHCILKILLSSSLKNLSWNEELVFFKPTSANLNNPIFKYLKFHDFFENFVKLISRKTREINFTKFFFFKFVKSFIISCSDDSNIYGAFYIFTLLIFIYLVAVNSLD